MPKKREPGFRVERRAQNKWWAVNEPIDQKPEYRGPFESQGEAEAALLDLLNVRVWIERDGDQWLVRSTVLKTELPAQGPYKDKLTAEILAKEVTAELRTQLGLRPVPGLSADRGVFMEGGVALQEQPLNTIELGLETRPADFSERLKRAGDSTLFALSLAEMTSICFSLHGSGSTPLA